MNTRIVRIRIFQIYGIHRMPHEILRISVILGNLIQTDFRLAQQSIKDYVIRLTID